MTVLKATVCFCILVSATQALVPLTPEEALRPPKRLPPPPAPTLAPLPYALADAPRRGEFSSPLSAPGPSADEARSVPPVFRDEVRDAMGQFNIRYSNGDGTFADETGALISTDDGWEYVITKKGSYSYISPEGTQITVNYVADDKGFHPQISFS